MLDFRWEFGQPPRLRGVLQRAEGCASSPRLPSRWGRAARGVWILSTPLSAEMWIPTRETGCEPGRDKAEGCTGPQRNR